MQNKLLVVTKLTLNFVNLQDNRSLNETHMILQMMAKQEFTRHYSFKPLHGCKANGRSLLIFMHGVMAVAHYSLTWQQL